MKIFISYSRKDRSAVEYLVEQLERLGFTAWFDDELSHTGGQKWWSNILAQVRNCDLFVFALSQHSLDSEPCQREYRYAYSLNKRILPILIGDVYIPMLPRELQELQFVPYQKRTSEQTLALSASISNLPQPRSFPHPLPPELPAPISEQALLGVQLDKPQLSRDEQVKLLFELRQLYQEKATRRAAESLLIRFYQRDDLLAQMADDIRELIPDISQRLARPTQEFPSSLVRGQRTFRRLAIGIVVVVFLIVMGGVALVGRVLFNRFGEQPTNTPTVTSVAQNPTQTMTSTNTNTAVSATTVPTTAIPPTNRVIIGPPISGGNPRPAPTSIPTTAVPVMSTLPPVPPTAIPTTIVPPTAISTTIVAPTAVPTTRIPPTTMIPTTAIPSIPMVYVPPGCFKMGSDTGDANEKPAHDVCITKGFYIYKTEVTNQQYGAEGYYSGPNRPRDSVTWSEARAFCAKQGARLPTEAEWEYVARGPESRLYPWGNSYSASNVAERGNTGFQTVNVGSRPAGVSWVGAVDMVGNVWEWVNDNYNETYYGTSPKNDPPGSSTSTGYNIIRGASYYDNDPYWFRTSYRHPERPTLRVPNVGFRCAR